VIAKFNPKDSNSTIQADKLILNKIRGIVSPGKFTAIMGPSGYSIF